MHLTIRLLAVLVPCLSWSQITNILYPDFYTSYQQNMAFANVAFVPEELRGDFEASYRFQTGPFKQISTALFSGAKIIEAENGASHVLRALFLNENQGPYFSSPRGYANYAYRLPINDELFMSAGLAAGMVEKYYAGTAAAGNTSVFLPDASAGLLVAWRRWQMGIASFQLLNLSAQSLSSQVQYKRFFHLHVQREWDLGIDWVIKVQSLWRVLPLYEDEWVGGVSFSYLKTFGLGLLTRSNYEASLFVELVLDSDNDRLKLFFNYNNPFLSPHPYTKSSIELGVGYGLH